VETTQYLSRIDMVERTRHVLEAVVGLLGPETVTLTFVVDDRSLPIGVEPADVPPLPDSTIELPSATLDLDYLSAE
jgi:hypothetical protein